MPDRSFHAIAATRRHQYARKFTFGGVLPAHRCGQLVSRTAISGLDLVLSNDERGELNTLLLHAPDGRLRLRHLLPTLAPFYDLLLIDTQGARSVLLEMAVLASNIALSPVTPEILAARELRRGTLQLIEDIGPYRHLGIEPPPLHLLINRVHPVSSNARLIQQTLRQMFQEQAGVQILDTDVPAIEAYPRAATRGLWLTGGSGSATTSRSAAGFCSRPGTITSA